MERVLVSACLLGQPVRYNAQGEKIQHSIIDRWLSEDRIVAVCPELLAGFGVPRPAAEIVGSGGAVVLANAARVIEAGGRDVTNEFVLGAESALKIAKEQGVHVAVLTDGSPSCGTSYIYDGTFSGTKSYGQIGVTAALLSLHGIAVFNQHQLLEADQYLSQLDACHHASEQLKGT